MDDYQPGDEVIVIRPNGESCRGEVRSDKSLIRRRGSPSYGYLIRLAGKSRSHWYTQYSIDHRATAAMKR